MIGPAIIAWYAVAVAVALLAGYIEERSSHKGN